MKKILLFLLTLFIAPVFSKAQITYTVVNAENVDKKVVPYEGSRVLWAGKLDDSKSENAIVASKVSPTAPDDTLYIQQFTKTPEGYKLAWTTMQVHKGSRTIYFVGNRMAFSDVDKDGSMETFFLYGIKTPDGKPESVHLILHQKDVEYFVWSKYNNENNSYGELQYSPNYNELSSVIRDEVIKNWKGFGAEKE